MPATNASVSVLIGAELGKSFKGAFGSANKQLSSLGSAIKKVTDRANQIEAFRNSSRATKEASIAYRDARQKLDALSKEIAATDSPSKQLQNNFRKAKRLADQTKKSFLETANSTRQMGKALRSGGIDIKNFNLEQAKLSKNLNLLKRRQSALQNNQNAKDKNLSNRANYRSQMVDAVALGGVLYSAVKPAVDFELAMAKVGAITNEAADSKGFKALTKQARELGRTTQYTASQASEAMQFLGMAGLNTNQILAATPSVLNLAIAGNMDLGRTADIASNILTGFNMEAERTGEVADILAQASRSTNVNVEMLGQTMKFIAPAAAAVGGTLSETATLAGVLGDAGIQATMAGTMLRSTYLRLAAPAKAGAKALGQMRNEMGISAEEMPDVAKEALLAQKRLSGLGVKIFENGKMRSMVSILKEMHHATKNLADDEKLSIIKDIFGTRSTAGALAIFKSVETGRLDEVEQKINNANGAAKEMADRLKNTTSGAFKEFASAIESVGISIGSVLLPAFASIAKTAANVAGRVSIFAEKFPVLTKYLGLAIAGMISFKVASIGMGFAFTFLKGGFLSAKGALLAYKTAMTLISFSIPKVILGIKALGIAIMSNPIGLIIGGIAIAAGLLIKNWQPVGEFFKNLFSGVIGYVKKAFEWVSKLLKPLSKIKDVVGKGISSVKGIFSDDEANNQSQIGDTIKDLESTDTDFSKIIETSNISNIAGSSSNSNISISAPITINAHTNADEKTIANQVRIAIDDVMHKFAVRKQALNFD
jgi:TP901 family phage tail tape measure protein